MHVILQPRAYVFYVYEYSHIISIISSARVSTLSENSIITLWYDAGYKEEINSLILFNLVLVEIISETFLIL